MINEELPPGDNNMNRGAAEASMQEDAPPAAAASSEPGLGLGSGSGGGDAAAPRVDAPQDVATRDSLSAMDDKEGREGSIMPNDGGGGGGSLSGSAHIRPVFLGNLDFQVTAEEISDIFTRPYTDTPPMPVERVDLKRGFAFVFLEDAKSDEEKLRVEDYVDRINGMYVSSSSSSSSSVPPTCTSPHRLRLLSPSLSIHAV